MDLHKVTFPTFVLEPWSVLERITDFIAHRASGSHLWVRESVQLCVMRREADQVGGELDAGDFGEVQGEREKTGAAGVNEVGWRWRVREGGKMASRTLFWKKEPTW